MTMPNTTTAEDSRHVVAKERKRASRRNGSRKSRQESLICGQNTSSSFDDRESQTQMATAAPRPQKRVNIRQKMRIPSTDENIDESVLIQQQESPRASYGGYPAAGYFYPEYHDRSDSLAFYSQV